MGKGSNLEGVSLVYTFKRKSDGKDVKYCQVIKNIFNLRIIISTFIFECLVQNGMIE